MTKEEVEKFIELKKKVDASLLRVCSYFKKLNSDYDLFDPKEYMFDCESKTFFDSYYDDCLCIDAKWLYATDEELQKYVDEQLEKKKKDKEWADAVRARMDKEARRLQYEELKKEFENV